MPLTLQTILNTSTNINDKKNIVAILINFGEQINFIRCDIPTMINNAELNTVFL